jgi:hypothetical protein
MAAPTYSLWVRDAALDRVALVDDYQHFQAVLNLNDAGKWTLVLNATNANGTPNPAVEALRDAGMRGGLIVYRNQSVLLSGTVTEWQENQGQQGPTVTIYGEDDTACIEHYKALPTPAGPIIDSTGVAYYPDGHYTITQKAEFVLKDLVDKNMGPTAGATLPRRLLLGLTIEPDGGRGATVTATPRFDNLLDLLNKKAAEGGVRFQIRQQSDAPRARQFRVDVPADRRQSVRFSRELGNLGEVQSTETTASANYVYAGAQGEQDQRQFVEGGDGPSINRYGYKEAFLDTRDLSANTALPAIRTRLAETLDAGGGSVSLTFKPLDAPYEFGVDYDLGDRVTVLVNGVATDGLMRSVTLTLDGQGGATIEPFVATANVAQAAMVGVVPRLSTTGERVSFLERNAEGFTWRMGLIWYGPVSEIPAGWELVNGSDPAIGSISLVGRMPIGVGAIPGSAIVTTLGQQIGAPTLVTAAMPAHTHTLSVSGTTVATTHVHTLTNGTANASAAGEAAHTHGPGSLTPTSNFTDPTHAHAATGITVSNAGESAHTHVLTNGTANVSNAGESSHTHAPTGITVATETDVHVHGIAINSDAVGGNHAAASGADFTAYSTAGGVGHAHPINGYTGSETGGTASGAHHHLLSGSTAAGVAHTHTATIGGATDAGAPHTHTASVGGNTAASSPGLYTHTHTLSGSSAAGTAHTHTLTVGGATDSGTVAGQTLTSTGTSGSTGSGADGGNIPPATAVHFIVRMQ